MENHIMYQNRVMLIGFLGQDAEVRSTKGERSFVVLSLATKRSWKDPETGQRRSQTTWHRCIVWGRLADFAATLCKGAHVQIEGEIRTREYTEKVGGRKPGDVKKSITEVRVASINKLDRSGASADAARTEAPAWRALPQMAGNPGSRCPSGVDYCPVLM